MKKVITMLLAVCLVLGLSVGVFAATMTPRVDTDVVKAGEQVKVTISLDQQLENVVTLAYKLYFDADLFDYTSKKNSTTLTNANINVSVSKVKTDAKGSYVNFSCLDQESEGYTLPAGDIVELTFTAKADVAEKKASFEAEFENFMDSITFKPVTTGHGAGPAATVTVKPAASSTSAYAAAVSGTTTIAVNDTAVVNVTVSSASETSFNAYALTLTYDANVLTYKSVSPAAQKVTDNNGTLTILDYGADKNVGGKIAITFEGKAGGKSEVKLTEARVDKSENAAVQDAPKADVTTASATITVSASYSVSLPGDFTGAETAESGKDYTFTAKNTNYTYTFHATMGGSEVTVVNNGDGTYTVKNVTGNLSIAVNKKTGKEFKVTISGTASTNYGVADKATYGENFEFSASGLEPEKYDYLVTATVNGRKVTVNADDSILEFAQMMTYTIPASEVTGDIAIVANQVEKTPATTTVTVSGTGIDDVTAAPTAENGKDYTFKVAKKSGFTYTVKAMQDGKEIPVTEKNGNYTIAAQYMNGKAITITVTKSADITVAVSEYLQLSGKNVYLVTVTGTAGEGKAFAYDGAVMFTSEKYGAAAYLVIAENAPTVDAVKAKVTVVTAAAEAIAYTGDVNGSGKVDVNDAQLVYDLYNAKYDSFTSVSMLKFLRADVNGDKTVNTNDAAAVINLAQ